LWFLVAGIGRMTPLHPSDGAEYFGLGRAGPKAGGSCLSEASSFAARTTAHQAARTHRGRGGNLRLNPLSAQGQVYGLGRGLAAASRQARQQNGQPWPMAALAD